MRLVKSYDWLSQLAQLGCPRLEVAAQTGPRDGLTPAATYMLLPVALAIYEGNKFFQICSVTDLKT